MIEVPFVPQPTVPPSFIRGTEVRTTDGLVLIQNLKRGDEVFGCGFRNVEHNASTPKTAIVRNIRVNPSRAHLMMNSPWLTPLTISSGSLGPGFPERDLFLSPSWSKLAPRGMRANTVVEHLVAARKQLLSIDGIRMYPRWSKSAYYHLLFDGHFSVDTGSIPTDKLLDGVFDKGDSLRAFRTFFPEACPSQPSW